MQKRLAQRGDVCLHVHVDSVEYIQTHFRTPCSFNQEVKAEEDDGL